MKYAINIDVLLTSIKILLDNTHIVSDDYVYTNVIAYIGLLNSIIKYNASLFWDSFDS